MSISADGMGHAASSILIPFVRCKQAAIIAIAFLLQRFQRDKSQGG
jgi:hypothetical protein